MDLSKTREQILSERAILATVEALAEGKIESTPELKDKVRLANSRDKARQELSSECDSRYQAGAAVNGYGDKASAAANTQMKLIADNFVLGHEDRLAIDGAALDLVNQLKAKATDDASLRNAITELVALRDSAGANLASYKTFMSEYDQIVKDAKPGYWLSASQKLKQANDLLKSDPKLLGALAADQLLAGPRNSTQVTAVSADGSTSTVDVGGLEGKNFEDAKGVLDRMERSRKDDIVKVEAELKRLEVRAYDNLIALAEQPWGPKVTVMVDKPNVGKNGSGSKDTNTQSGGNSGNEGNSPVNEGGQPVGDAGNPITPVVEPKPKPKTDGPIFPFAAGDYFMQLGLTNVDDHTSLGFLRRNKTNEGAMIRMVEKQSVLYAALLADGRNIDDLKVTQVGTSKVTDKASFLKALEEHNGQTVRIILVKRANIWGTPGDQVSVEITLPALAAQSTK